MHHATPHVTTPSPRRAGTVSVFAAWVLLAMPPADGAADGIVPARLTSQGEGRRDGVRGEREYIIRDTRRSKRGELDCSARGSHCVIVNPGDFRGDPMKRKDREYLWKRKR